MKKIFMTLGHGHSPSMAIAYVHIQVLTWIQFCVQIFTSTLGKKRRYP